MTRTTISSMRTEPSSTARSTFPACPTSISLWPRASGRAIILGVRQMTLGFLLAGLMAAACGPGASSPTPLVRASQPSSTRTPPPTALATASAESSEPPFASSVYPYTLQLPSGVAHRNWRPATRPWRTDERIDSVAAFNDANGAADGSIFILGAAWDGTLESFRDLIATNVSRFHGCSAPNGLRS